MNEKNETIFTTRRSPLAAYRSNTRILEISGGLLTLLLIYVSPDHPGEGMEMTGARSCPTRGPSPFAEEETLKRWRAQGGHKRVANIGQVPRNMSTALCIL